MSAANPIAGLTVVILTFNETLHLRRALESARQISNDIVVVDSLSTDDTVVIAAASGARVLERAWENNHSIQFNWAIAQLEQDLHWQGQWIFRLDADEIITPQLAEEMRQVLPSAAKEIVGYRCQRSIAFMGRLLRFGGMSHNRILRLYRRGCGYSEARWMDEHIVVNGPYGELAGAIVDDNLNNLTWWSAKHNIYASRAAVDYLLRKYGANSQVNQLPQMLSLKDRIYRILPLGLRGFAFYVYRYFFLLGFMDGKAGAYFYFLQIWWYRTLVDAKIIEVEQCMKDQAIDCKTAIERTLGITV